MKTLNRCFQKLGFVLLTTAALTPAFAQTPAAPGAAAQPAAGAGRGGGRGGFGGQGPAVISPEVLADHKVTFRVLAPRAEAVRLSAGDIPGSGPAGAMKKGTNGVWEVTLGPIDPGAYRYNFNV